MRTKILKATLAIMAVLLMASGFAIAANAKTFGCDEQVCIGTIHRDHITGSSKSQTFSGKQDRDTITDTARGDNDDLRGGKGNDVLNTQEGRNGPAEKDVVDGGPGHDQCTIDENDDAFNCESVIRS